MADRLPKPFLAARIERLLDARIEQFFRRLGWRDRVICYISYGSPASLRVLARVIMAPGHFKTVDLYDAVWLDRRGWRNFFHVACVNRGVEVRVGDRVIQAVTDRDGYLDVQVVDHGLTPGWHHLTIQTDDELPSQAKVFIVNPTTQIGLITDVDDTVLSTHLPRPLTAIWNSAVATEQARQPVTGMARFYRDLLHHHIGAPVFYVSTGTWGMFPFLQRFLLRHGFPAGPLILSDFGPTNYGWFRSAYFHKYRALRSLLHDFPQIRWLLVGDDGQNDPRLYHDLAGEFPDQVVGIAIRQLNPVEQMLAGGPKKPATSQLPPGIWEIRGGDGHQLRQELGSLL